MPLRSAGARSALDAWVRQFCHHTWSFAPSRLEPAPLSLPRVDADVLLDAGMPNRVVVVVAGESIPPLELLGLSYLLTALCAGAPQLIIASPALARALHPLRATVAQYALLVAVQAVQVFVDLTGEAFLLSLDSRPPPDAITPEAVEQLLRAAVQRMNHEVRNKAMAIRGTAECALRTRNGALDSETERDLTAIVNSVDELSSALERFHNVRQFLAQERAGVPIIEVPSS